MKKMLKEKDKLEKQALVERMQQRDLQQTNKHFSNVVENQDVQLSSGNQEDAFQQLKNMVPELRAISR